MQRAGDRPPKHDDEKPSTGAKTIEETTAANVESCVGEQERSLQVRELLVRNGNAVLDRSNGHGQRLTVEVAYRDGGGNERDRIPGAATVAAQYCAEL